MPLVKSINQDDLRNHNLSVVLSAMARSREPMSRAALAKETGLTKATLSLLSDILLRNGVIRQLKPTVGASFGRPSTPLTFDAGRWVGLGMQINTDGYGYTVLDLTGTVVDSAWVERSLDGASPTDVFDWLDELVTPVERRLARRGFTVTGAQLALPGLVTNHNMLLNARNLGWRDLDLTRFDVFRRLDTEAANEATLAAIAQIPGYASQRSDGDWPIGPLDSFVYLSTDVGIGGAFVRGGQIVMGDNGFAGEVGHVSVNLRGPLCRCGRHGCLELYAGRRAMMIDAGLADGDKDATCTELLPRLHAAWRGGDTKAVFAVENAVSALAGAIASTVNILDIDTVILGGLWSEFGDDLRENLERRVQSQILARDVLKVRLLFPPITEHPAMYGAAVMGLDALFRNPLAFMDAD